MNIHIYFAKPSDTAIAAENTSLIDALARTADKMPGVQATEQVGKADIVLIDERYQYRTWHYADDLSSCQFIRQHAERIYVLNHDDHAHPFLPGLYTSLEKSRPAFVKTIPIPYKWDLWHVPVPQIFEFDPQVLYTFRGAFHTHPIRKRMCRVLSASGQGTCQELRKTFHSHDADDQTRHINEIRAAHFSLCPRGLSPSTYRLYESMQLGRCPVIIADDWVAPAGPDWESFAIFVPQAQIKRLPQVLAQHIDHAHKYGQLAAQAWQEWFSWPQRWRYFIDQVLVLLDKEAKSYNFSQLQDFWRSKTFYRRYRWTLMGRARSLLVRKYRALGEPMSKNV